MFAFTGKILRVNLSEGKVAVEDIPEDWMKKYLGGIGVGSMYVYMALADRDAALVGDRAGHATAIVDHPVLLSARVDPVALTTEATRRFRPRGDGYE